MNNQFQLARQEPGVHLRLVYSSDLYPFRQEIAKSLGVPDIALEQLDDSEAGLQETGKDQATRFHKRFYGNNLDFLSLYERFVRDFVKPKIGVDFVYQKVPTFRVHLQENLAVGSWHKDSDYGHDLHELNFWVPVTRAFDSSTIWFDNPAHAENLDYGQVLVFRGSEVHGNKVNRTGQTRVSFDFRILPRQYYVESDRTSLAAKVPFKIGGYWKALD